MSHSLGSAEPLARPSTAIISARSLRRILGTETGHCKSIPRGDADFTAEGFGQLANPLHQRLVARHDQRGADRHAAFGHRRPGELFADLAVEPHGFGEYQPAAAPHAASDRRTRHAAFARPSRARPNTTISHSKSEAPSARSISIRRDTRARSNRMVSCGSQAKCEPAAAFRAILSWAAVAGGAIDLFGGRRRHRQPRSLASLDVDVETVAAGDAAGGVDEDRRKAVRLGETESAPAASRIHGVRGGG